MRGNRSSEHATAERTNAHNKDSGSSACFQPQPKHMAKEAIRLAFSWRQGKTKRLMLSQMQHVQRDMTCGLYKLCDTLQFISLHRDP